MMQYNISWLYVYFANLGGLALAKCKLMQTVVGIGESSQSFTGCAISQSLHLKKNSSSLLRLTSLNL